MRQPPTGGDCLVLSPEKAMRLIDPARATCFIEPY
jgi:hypothetical protein